MDSSLAQSPSQATPNLPVVAAEGASADDGLALEDASVLKELVARPLIGIAEELSSLRTEAAYLREEKRVLERVKVEMHTLRKEQAALKGAVKYFMEQSGCLPGPTYFQQPAYPGNTRFPHEVLLAIFREARAPRFDRDPSVMQSTHSAWLADFRFRKALTLVCKHWVAPATEQLYEDIVLRRMGQVVALAAMLAGDQRRPGNHRGLATLIKSIRLDKCIIVWACADAVREALAVIFALCTALRVFEFHIADGFAVPLRHTPAEEYSGTFFSQWFVDPQPAPFQLAYRDRLSTLRVLDLAFTLSYSQAAHLHDMLSGMKNLETLKLLSVQRVLSEGDALVLQPVVDLPRLTDLYIPVSDTRFVDCTTAAWKMPLLQRLTTIETSRIPVGFLQAHGRRLTYLNLYPRRSSWVSPADQGETISATEAIFDLCPLVEHLVLPPWVFFLQLPLLGPPPHPFAKQLALKYLDWWLPSLRRAAELSQPHDWNVAHPYPLVRRVLLLEMALISSSISTMPMGPVDLPLLCAPETPLRGEECRYVRMLDTRVRQTREALVPDGGVHLDEFPSLGFEDDDVDDSGSFFFEEEEGGEEGEEENEEWEEGEERVRYSSDESSWDSSSGSDEESRMDVDADEEPELDEEDAQEEGADQEEEAEPQKDSGGGELGADEPEREEEKGSQKANGEGQVSAEDEPFSEDEPDYHWPPDKQLDFSTVLEMYRKAATLV